MLIRALGEPWPSQPPLAGLAAAPGNTRDPGRGRCAEPRGFSAPEEAAPPGRGSALPAHPIPIITINSQN